MNRAAWLKRLRTAVMQRLLPKLPGTWRIRDDVVYREPVHWLLCCLVFRKSRWSTDFSVFRHVQLLAVPRLAVASLDFLEIGRGNGRQLWQLPTSDADEEALVAELYEYLQVEALPVFERANDMHTYVDDAQRIAQKYPANALAHEGAFISKPTRRADIWALPENHISRDQLRGACTVPNSSHGG
jgi:hypothetical protein